MNTTKNHTPLPWKLEDVHHDGGRWISTSGLYSVRVIGGTFNSRVKPKIDDDERDANAALIVQAVNSHADLLAACEAASKVFDSILGMAYNPTNQPAMELRAKIQKADNAIKDALTKSRTL